MGYKTGVDRDQVVLFPPTLDEFVSAEHPVRVIDAFVSGLDMAALGFQRASPAEEGRPAYDPRDLLRLSIYGYLNRTRSSRRLERETHRNLEVMWLMRLLKPDHKTIAEFRRQNPEALRQASRRFTLVCKGLDLFGSELVFIDGTKIRAVNGKDRNFTEAKLAKLLKEIDKEIDEYLAALEAQDAAEEGQPGATDPELGAKLKALEDAKKEYEKYLESLKESGESQLSLTDAESRLMKIQGDMKVCYNAQIAVDPKHHLIVVEDVTNQVSDEAQLAPMAIAAKEMLGVEALDAAADAGYHVATQVVECEANGITPYAPKPKTSSHNAAKGKFTKEDFTYCAKENAYRCPAGQMLRPAGKWNREGREIQYFRNREACAACPLRENCTKDKEGRRISRLPEEERLEAMAERLKGRPELMLQRKSTVEHPFGTMKWWDGGGFFLLKGLKKVRGEFSLMVLAYNLRRVMNLLGVKCLLEALKTGKMPVAEPV